jgi:hypothetical protein
MIQIIIDEDERGKIILDSLSVDSIKITYSTELEKLTGADFAISTMPVPFTESTLRLHCNEKFIAVQVKRGMDFPASIMSPRLKESIAKMISIVRKPAQRVLLFVGTDGRDEHGRATIDGRPIESYTSSSRERDDRRWVNPMTIMYAKQAWIARGGTFSQVAHSSEIVEWTQVMIRILETETDGIFFPASPSKGELLPDELGILPISLVPDAWVVLAAHKGIGTKTIQALTEKYGENYVGMFEELTNPFLESDVYGIGKGTITKVRGMWRLEPWEMLGRVVFPGLAEDAGIDYFDSMRCNSCPLQGENPIDMGGTLIPCDQQTKDCRRGK